MQQDISIGIGDLVRFLWRGALIALLIGGGVAAAVFLLRQRQVPVYEAKATVLAAQTVAQSRQFDISLITAPPLDVSAYREATLSTPVLTSALELLGNTGPDQQVVKRLRGRIAVDTESTRTSSLIFIRSKGNSPELAVRRANAVAQSLVSWDQQRAGEGLDQVIAAFKLRIEALDKQIQSLQLEDRRTVQDQIDGLIKLRAEQQQQLAYAQALGASVTGLLKVLQPALPPTRPVSPRPRFDATLAFVVAIFLTYGLLLVRQALDTRLRSAEDLVAVSGLPILGEFPKARKEDRSVFREASSYLRTNLLFSTAEAHPKVFLVTSPQEGDGKTAIASSLAESFTRNGYRTLLVDADLRSPSLAGLYRISGVNRSSLQDWLSDPFGNHQAVPLAITPTQPLFVVPVFRAVTQAAELLSMGFQSCLEKWRQEYDVIIIDSAPILAVADALTVAPFCTGTVLVVNQQQTDRRQVRVAVELLKRIGVRILGVAATHVSGETKRVLQYGYGYAGPAQPVEAPGPAGDAGAEAVGKS